MGEVCLVLGVEAALGVFLDALADLVTGVHPGEKGPSIWQSVSALMLLIKVLLLTAASFPHEVLANPTALLKGPEDKYLFIVRILFVQFYYIINISDSLIVRS